MKIDAIEWTTMDPVEAPDVATMASALESMMGPTIPAPQVAVVAVRDVFGLLPWLVLEAPLEPDLLVDFCDDGDGPVRLDVRVGQTTRAVLDALPEWEP